MDFYFEDTCLSKQLLHNPGHNCKNWKHQYVWISAFLFLSQSDFQSNKRHFRNVLWHTSILPFHFVFTSYSAKAYQQWSHENYDNGHLRFLPYHQTKSYMNNIWYDIHWPSLHHFTSMCIDIGKCTHLFSKSAKKRSHSPSSGSCSRSPESQKKTTNEIK